MAGNATKTTAIARQPAGISITSTDELIALATIIYKAGPVGFSKPEQIAVAIAFGLEIGLKPATAVNLIKVVNGKPSCDGEGALALLQASGLLAEIDHGVRGEGESKHGYITTKRKGETTARTTTFSVADAVKAELWSKKGPWQQYPERMLRWRAIGHHAKDWWADVMCGIALFDGDVIEAEVVSVRPNPPQPQAQAAPPQAQAIAPPPPSANGTHTAAVVPAPIADRMAVSVPSSTSPIADEQIQKFVATKNQYLSSLGIAASDLDASRAAWTKFVARWGVESVLKMTNAQANEALAVIYDAIHTPEEKALFSSTPGSNGAVGSAPVGASTGQG